MNSLIVAHVRPPNAYGITRAIEKDKEKKKQRRSMLSSRFSVQLLISIFLFVKYTSSWMRMTVLSVVAMNIAWAYWRSVKPAKNEKTRQQSFFLLLLLLVFSQSGKKTSFFFYWRTYIHGRIGSVGAIHHYSLLTWNKKKKIRNKKKGNVIDAYISKHDLQY